MGVQLDITLVDQILSLKQKDPQVDTSALEKQIDVMVCKLYGLTCEEVKIIGAVGRVRPSYFNYRMQKNLVLM